jgi:putative transposase
VVVTLEVGSRRILHHKVTDHPTAEWTLQRFREGMAGEHEYRFLIHDRDSIFSAETDQELESRQPVRRELWGGTDFWQVEF